MVKACREFYCGSNEGFHENIRRVFEDYIGAKVTKGEEGVSFHSLVLQNRSTTARHCMSGSRVGLCVHPEKII